MLQATDPYRLVLLEAANIIRHRGHCKGSLKSDSAVCIVGSLNVALHGTPYYHKLSYSHEEQARHLDRMTDLVNILFNYLRLPNRTIEGDIICGVRSLTEWNDKFADEDLVIRTLEGAALSSINKSYPQTGVTQYA